MSYNTRIAPSPTGDFHIGTARTAYFNWLAARATGGTFTVRIDDTDENRNNSAMIAPIFDSLTWLGLNWDNTFNQSSQQHKYIAMANSLVQANLARRGDDGAVYLNWDNSYPRVWTDSVIGNVKITDDDIANISNLVLLRNYDYGNKATYHFSSVYDDYTTGINYIIRGRDHVTNTSRQVAIWAALDKFYGHNRPLPKFSHVGLLFTNGKKISKRDGASSCLKYKEDGIHPEAMLNFLLRLGWSPTIDDKSTALLPTNRALELFLIGGKMKNGDANTDFLKLASFDRKYKARAQRSIISKL